LEARNFQNGKVSDCIRMETCRGSSLVIWINNMDLSCVLDYVCIGDNNQVSIKVFHCESSACTEFCLNSDDAS
jgi:hypothetical protein